MAFLARWAFHKIDGSGIDGNRIRPMGPAGVQAPRGDPRLTYYLGLSCRVWAAPHDQQNNNTIVLN